MLMFSNRADAQKRTAALTLSNGRVFDQLDMRNEVASTWHVGSSALNSVTTTLQLVVRILCCMVSKACVL